MVLSETQELTEFEEFELIGPKRHEAYQMDFEERTRRER